MIDRSRFWDAVYVVGGVLLAGLTLQSYRGFDAPSGKPSQNRLSSFECDRIILSAKSFISSNPEDFNAWSRLAIAYFNQGPASYADALNALDKARQLGATSESLFYYAGVMYEALGLPDYALNELSKYLRHYPDDYETQLRLANILAEQKKNDEAYKLYKLLSQKGSRDPTLWFNFALVSKEKGDLDGALACFAKLNSLTQDRPEGGIYQEGEVHRLKGEDDQAILLYQREISLHPKYLPSLIALEAAQRRKGLSKEARETHKIISALKAK
jgi:tetratricopeptide (TPR) repeat protein